MGFWVYGAAADGNRKYSEGFAKKSCIVIGSEEKGLRNRISNACDFLVTIPIRIESLNASHACTILLCEVCNGVNND